MWKVTWIGYWTRVILGEGGKTSRQADHLIEHLQMLYLDSWRVNDTI